MYFMNKNLLILGGLGLTGFIGYMLLKKNTVVGTGAQNVVGGSPSQQYPFLIPESPRQDNASQPWYGGDRTMLQTPDSSISGLQQAAAQINAAGSIVNSLSSLWENLDVGSWFQADDALTVNDNFTPNEDYGFDDDGSNWMNA